ncbi:hypothetical protein [Streptacidiphilus jiangxiensis]|uniref:PH domain-containing protein n=1 Tax=Streptacidiphilus jiangxiensis TaxID=235985 RepID=A0A1H7MUR9_STRJI|nr:hypothetical protein [Streptacidiphilus jiangxiensis]SEL14779.1 hypothetical protein SAMN05414137_10668 [Streptacidiphilus jiangxiensis]
MRSEGLWLERSPAARYGLAVSALLIVGVGPAVLFAKAPIDSATAWLGGSCAVLMALALGFRIARAYVYADSEGVVIRGYLRNRNVAIADVIGVEADRLYWCGRHGRLRRSRLAAVAAPVSKVSGGMDEILAYHLQRRLRRWTEQAVGAKIKRRAHLVRNGHLDDAAVAREAVVGAAGVQWEKRWRLFGAKPQPRWGELQAAAERELTARSLRPTASVLAAAPGRTTGRAEALARDGVITPVAPTRRHR